MTEHRSAHEDREGHPNRDGSAPRPTAVLVAVQLPGISDEAHEADLAELKRLVDTLGYRVLGAVTQKRDALAAAAVLGEGKLRELASYTGGSGEVPSAAPERKSKARARFQREADDADDADPSDSTGADEDAEWGADDAAAPAAAEPLALGRSKVDVVVVDHEISPSQARNLERAISVPVLDRTGVIIEIFNRHARSREARLQVEIARLVYVAPRLRETGGGSERQRGKGAGESALELDRRKIRDRIAELRHELAHIAREQGQRRYARRDQLRVALVGYTNAGKSSLMRALTGSEVYVADRLFATLDTTVRALHPETKPRLLVSDTVGFIKKLPHDLVASFRSTLDEALEASLLLYVVDASDPTHEQQLDVTMSVLREIGADSVPSRLVLNKCDRLDDEARRALEAKHPDAWFVSAKDAAEVAKLRAKIVEHFEQTMEEGELVVPYAQQSLVSEIHASSRVLSEEYDESGAHLRVRTLPALLAKFRAAVERPR
jgi:GTP-binding protein HflX